MSPAVVARNEGIPEAKPLLMAGRKSEFSSGRPIRPQLIGDHHLGHEALLFEQLAHELYGRCLVALALNKEIENLAFTVHSTPKPEPLARDHYSHFIEMPLPGRPSAAAAQRSREDRTKL